MKKRLLSLLITGVMMLGLMPNVIASTTIDGDAIVLTNKFTQQPLTQTNFNPYLYTKANECYGYHGQLNPGGTNGTEGDIMGNVNALNYIIFKNMTFDKSPKTLDFYFASNHTGGTSSVTLRKNGRDGEIIASIQTQKTDSWTTPFKKTVEVINPSICTGTFDIYVKAEGSSFGNICGFQFQWQYEEISEPTIDTAAKKATASVSRLMENDETRQVKLLLAGYDANGAMVDIGESESKAIPNNGTQVNFAAEIAESATGFGAYFWYDDDTYAADANLQNVAAESPEVTTTEKIEVIADNGWITISGTDVENEDINIAVVPTSYNTSATMYSQSASILQLYTTTVENEKYSYKFKMPSSVATGSYKAVVKGATINEAVNFQYKDPDEIYNNVLLPLSTSTSEETTWTLVKNNIDVFGMSSANDSSLFSDNGDKAVLKTAIDEFFDADGNELSHQESGNYSFWTNGLKKVIAPVATVSYIKNVKNVEKSVEYIDKFNEDLGIKDNDKYKTYFAECKGNIVSALISNDSQNLTTDNFVARFEEAVVVGHFNTAETWGQSGEALLTFKNDLKPQITDDAISLYRSLINTAKQELMNKFKDKVFKTKNAIAEFFMANVYFYDSDEYKTKSKYELEPSKVNDNDEFTMEVWHENKAEEETTEQKAFEDLDSVSWAKTSINYMRSIGVVNGKSETRFAPNDSITREEFAAIVVRAFGLGAGDANSVSFADVNKSAWYAAYIAKAAERGIVNGMENNRFGVGQNVTREQIAAMLARAVKATNKNIIPKKSRVGFTDFAYISDYAYDAVSTLAKAEIINGTGNDNFSPKKSATRAEAVVMLYRLLTNIK